MCSTSPQVDLCVRMPFGEGQDETDRRSCVLRPLHLFASRGGGIGQLAFLYAQSNDGEHFCIASICQTKSGNVIVFPGLVQNRIGEVWFGRRLSGLSANEYRMDHLTLTRDRVNWHMTSRRDGRIRQRTHALNEHTGYWFGMSTTSVEWFERACRKYVLSFTPSSDEVRERLVIISSQLDESPRCVFRLPMPIGGFEGHYLHFDFLVLSGGLDQLPAATIHAPTTPPNAPQSLTVWVRFLDDDGYLVMIGSWIEGSITHSTLLTWT